MLDRNKNASSQPPLKGVYIVGNRQSIFPQVKKFFAQDGYMILGDGKTPIHDIDLSELTGRIDNRTIFNIHAHGYALEGMHYIDNDTSINFLKKIDALQNGAAKNITPISCYGGMAVKEI